MNKRKCYAWLFTILSIAWTANMLTAIEIPFYWLGGSQESQTEQNSDLSSNSEEALTNHQANEPQEEILPASADGGSSDSNSVAKNVQGTVSQTKDTASLLKNETDTTLSAESKALVEKPSQNENTAFEESLSIIDAPDLFVDVDSQLEQVMSSPTKSEKLVETAGSTLNPMPTGLSKNSPEEELSLNEANSLNTSETQVFSIDGNLIQDMETSALPNLFEEDTQDLSSEKSRISLEALTDALITTPEIPLKEQERVLSLEPVGEAKEESPDNSTFATDLDSIDEEELLAEESLPQKTNTGKATSIFKSLEEETPSLSLETRLPDYSSKPVTNKEEQSPKQEIKEVVSLEENTAAPFTVVENQAKTAILTPSFSEQKTAKIALANGLEVLIISDPEANHSGAALSVESGSWKDPENLPGMAHFLEHMLFLGTEKYPEENGFKSFVQENNGKTNAYTAGDHTTYAFSIDNSAFEEALDRFSQQFIDPLLSPSGIERELHAVDQEFAKSMENDHIRRLFIQKEIANKYHPDTKFHYGNIDTLKGVTREDLQDWFDKHYSSNLMHLSIISPLHIEQLQKLVAEHFSSIQNVDAKAISPQTTLSSPTFDANIVYFNPLKEERRITLQWELSTEFALDRDNRTMDIVAHVLGHEGKESLLALLKKEELAEALITSGRKVGPNNALFSIEIVLTKNGLQKVNTVFERCFEAISYFKNNGIPPYIFDEIQQMALNRYQYQSRQDVFTTVMHHARNLVTEQLATYPEQTELYGSFNPRSVRRLLAELSPDHCHITVAAPTEETAVKTDRIEKWIGVEYTVQPIPERTLNSWYNVTANPEIDLPSRNPFIPHNLEIVNLAVNDIEPRPITLFDDESGRAFFAPDTQYQVPEVNWFFKIRSPKLTGDVQNTVLTDLYIKTVREHLNPVSYQAQLAGLDYSLAQGHASLELSLVGYSSKAASFYQEILNALQTASPTETEFELYKQSLRQQYENFAKNSPLQQSNELLQSVIYDQYVTMEERAKNISYLSYEDFLSFLSQLYESTYVESLLYGNLTAAQAREVWNNTQASLASLNYPKENHPNKKLLILPQSVGPFYLVEKTERQGNAVLLMLQNGPFSFKNRAAQQILSKGIQEPFYNTLRTQQQTGYIVWNWNEEIERQLYSFFAVQSNTHNVRDLLARFELFLESFLQEFSLSSFPEERFSTLKRVLITELEQPRKSLEENARLLKTLAFEYEGDFDWLDKRIQGLEELDYSEFVDLSQAFIGRNNKQRLAILMKGVIPEENSFFYYRVNTSDKMRKISDYLPKEAIR